MGWEQRNGNQYYYHKRRIGKTIQSEYIGSEYLGMMFAKKIELRREKRKQNQLILNHQMEEDREMDKELDTLGNMLTRLTYAELLHAGYHTHKGQWRKKKNV